MDQQEPLARLPQQAGAQQEAAAPADTAPREGEAAQAVRIGREREEPEVIPMKEETRRHRPARDAQAGDEERKSAGSQGYVFAALSGPPARPAAQHPTAPPQIPVPPHAPEPQPAPLAAAPGHARRGSAGRAAVAVLALAAALGIGWAARGWAQGVQDQAASVSLSAASLRPEEESPAGPAVSGAVEDLKADGPADPDLWSLMLANTQHPLPDGYAPPSLAEMDGEGRQLDSRIAQAFRDMVAAAEEDGCHLVLLSGYRSEERQKTLFVQMLEDYRAMGYSELEAWDATKGLRNIPGTSEHQTGLAADIVADDYWSLDEGFAETDEARWLVENAADYGFILRYPKDKTHITGTSYEPWHYRYVGVEDAQKIMSRGITLEEYLGQV